MVEDRAGENVPIRWRPGGGRVAQVRRQAGEGFQRCPHVALKVTGAEQRRGEAGEPEERDDYERAGDGHGEDDALDEVGLARFRRWSHERRSSS